MTAFIQLGNCCDDCDGDGCIKCEGSGFDRLRPITILEPPPKTGDFVVIEKEAYAFWTTIFRLMQNKIVDLSCDKNEAVFSAKEKKISGPHTIGENCQFCRGDGCEVCERSGYARLRVIRMGQQPSERAEYVAIERGDYVRWTEAKTSEFKVLVDELSKSKQECDELRGVNTRLAAALDDAVAERNAALARVAPIDAELNAALARVEKQTEAAARSTAPTAGPIAEPLPEPTPTWRQWLPIDTAPRDGSPIWVRQQSLKGWLHFWVYWSGDGWSLPGSTSYVGWPAGWMKSPIW